MASTDIRDRRRILRYRNLMIRQTVQLKNRVSGLLMKTGVSYNKRQLRYVWYFHDLVSTNPEVTDGIRPLLKICRNLIERSRKLDYALANSLEHDSLLNERPRRLRTVPGVGSITALTWALEMDDFTRFASIKDAISYCGLCGVKNSSADKAMRMPPSKQRNKHIQRVLVEAAKFASRSNPQMAAIYAREGRDENPTGPPWPWPASWSPTCWP